MMSKTSDILRIRRFSLEALLTVITLAHRFATATRGLSVWNVARAMNQAMPGHNWCGCTKGGILEGYMELDEWARRVFGHRCRELST